MYRAGLTIHQQESLIQFASLSYNELASAAIDQERMMKAIVEVEEKKRKKMVPRSDGSGSSSGAPPKYRMVYTLPGGQLRRPQQQQYWGQLHRFPTTAISIATAATIAAMVQPCSHPTATVGCHQATTAISHQQLSMLQLWEDGPLCSIMQPTQAKQLSVSSRARGQPAEGPSEGSCKMDSLRQLHHHGGDSHGRSASEYVLPQQTSYYYSI
jgi:hypothetical protein